MQERGTVADFEKGYDEGMKAVEPSVMPSVVQQALDLKDKYATQWRDRDDNYWLARLMQEVGELASSLVGDHPDPPEHELRQIASIALNWLEKRDDEVFCVMRFDKGAGEFKVVGEPA